MRVGIIVLENNFCVDTFVNEIIEILKENIEVVFMRCKGSFDNSNSNCSSSLVEFVSKFSLNKIVMIGGINVFRIASKFISMGVGVDVLFIPDASLPLGTNRIGQATLETNLFDLLLFLKSFSREQNCRVIVRFKGDLSLFVASSQFVMQMFASKKLFESQETEISFGPNPGTVFSEKTLILTTPPWFMTPLQEDIEFSRHVAEMLCHCLSEISGNCCLIFDDSFQLETFDEVSKRLFHANSCLNSV